MITDESAERDISREQRTTQHPCGEYEEHQWPLQQTLLHQRGPTEYGHCVQQQDVGGVIKPKTRGCMCGGSGKRNAARSHQASKQDHR